MAQPRGYVRNINPSNNAALTADRNRERERRRAVEKPEELPSFSEPRKITVGRQDPLSNQIKKVLGNVDSVQHAIRRDQNIWLGTSRNASTSHRNKPYPGDRSRDDPLHTNTTSSANKSHENYYPSNPSKPSFVSSSKPQTVQSRNVRPTEESSSSGSNKTSSSHSSTGAIISNFASKPYLHTSPDNQGQTRSLADEPISANNRNRLPSMDMPAAMEKIFGEMRMHEEEPISEIQTPQTGQEFNFTKHEVKEKPSLNSGNKQEMDSRNSDAGHNSESDSSDDDDSESDESVKEEEPHKWNLSVFLKNAKKPPNPSPGPGDDSSSKKSNGLNESDQHHRPSSRNTREQTSTPNPYREPHSLRNSNAARSTVKDEKKSDKRSSGRTGSARNSFPPKNSSTHLPPQTKTKKPVSNQSNWDSNRQPSHAQPKVKSVTSKSQKSSQPAYHSQDGNNKPFMSTAEHGGLPTHSPAPTNTLPSSVSNETLSSHPSHVHHRTAKKGPSSLLSARRSPPIEANDPGYTSRPIVLSNSSASDASDDEDGSSSNSDSDETGKDNGQSSYVSLSSNNDLQQGASNFLAKLSDDESDTDQRRPISDNVAYDNYDVIEKKARLPSNRSKTSQSRSSAIDKHHRGGRHKKASTKPPSPFAASPASQPDKLTPSVKSYRSLWVKVPISSTPRSTAAMCNARSKSDRQTTNNKQRKHNDRLLQNTRCDSTGFTLHTDSFPDQHVQVAVAESSSSVSPSQPRQAQKRKLAGSNPSNNSPSTKNTSSASNKMKRRKSQSSPHLSQHSVENTVTNPNTSLHSKQTKRESDHWRDKKDDQPSKQWAGGQSSINLPIANNKSFKPIAANDVHPGNLSNVAANLAEPDSSWPEQETRFKTSEQFMREGKRLKHEGDSYTDSKTGRTRAGEALSRALLYFHASLCFLMNGFMLEMENNSDRNDASRASHSPTSMYNQTINLLDYVQKMRPHDNHEEIAFKRLNISCLRTQALLYLRIFKLKKEIAGKYHEAISEHFKPNRSNHIPSPVSPAVPSPYGTNMPGPSPLPITNTTCEQVSSSTQVGKMTSPPTQNSVLLTPKIYEMFKQYHSIMGSLMLAHDKWEQADSLVVEHEDFFRHVDVLRGHSLNLDNSLEDLATYNKVILRQLRGAYKSPKD